MQLPKNLDPEFFKDSEGTFSMMRLVVFFGIKLARIVVLAGIAILIGELFYLKTGSTTGVILVGIGTAMFGMGEGAKVLQANSELKRNKE